MNTEVNIHVYFLYLILIQILFAYQLFIDCAIGELEYSYNPTIPDLLGFVYDS